MLTEFVLLYMSTYRSYLYFCSICTIIYHRNKLSLYHSLEKSQINFQYYLNGYWSFCNIARMAVFIRSFYIYSFHAWSVCLFELTSSHFRIQGPEIVVSKSSSFLWNTKITRLITYAQYIYNDAHVNMYSHVHVLLSAKTKVERRKFQGYKFLLHQQWNHLSSF